jgi:hypothetical protein
MTYPKELLYRVIGFPVATFALLFVTAELARLFHPPFEIGTALVLLGFAALGVWLAARILRPGLAAVAEAWLGLLAGRTTRPLAGSRAQNLRRGIIDLSACAAGLACAAWLFRAGVRDAALPATFAGVVLAFSAVFFSAGTGLPRLVAARRAPTPSFGDPAVARPPVKFLALATIGLALSFAVADRLPAVRFRGKPWPLSYGTWVHACTIAGGDQWCPAEAKFLVIPRSTRELRVEWEHSGPCVVRFTTPAGGLLPDHTKDSATEKGAYIVLHQVQPREAALVRIEPTSQRDMCWYSLRYTMERP